MMKIIATRLADVVVVETSGFADQRGVFSRFYCERELSSLIGVRRIVQINHSQNIVKGTVRGMHFQRAPHAEMKLVRCIKGRVWDVAVDLRAGSPTVLQWHGEELSAENKRMLVIPEGCAHGFQSLEADSELLYLSTAFFAPEAEGGVACDDPRLRIGWPLPVGGLSGRDQCHPLLAADFHGIVV